MSHVLLGALSRYVDVCMALILSVPCNNGRRLGALPGNYRTARPRLGFLLSETPSGEGSWANELHMTMTEKTVSADPGY